MSERVVNAGGPINHERVVNAGHQEAAELADYARELWHGLPFLWESEYRFWMQYSAHVGQILTREGLELWMTRVQAHECPVAGSACAKPKASHFCEHHRPGAPPGM